MKEPKIYQMSFASVYPLYIKKVEKKDIRKMKSMRLSVG